MKKYVLVGIISFFSLFSYSQSYDNAIGIRAGFSNGVTFKHMLGDSKGFELLLDTRWKGFNFTALYEVHKQAFDVEGLNWYYGFGAHVGSYRAYKNHPYFVDNNSSLDNNGNEIYRNYIVIGIDGIIGIEYNFEEVPINVSLDYKPAFNLTGYTGFWGDNGALSIRYYF